MRRRIALNGLFLDYANSGMWTYARNLVSALAAFDPDTEYHLSVRRSWPDFDAPLNLVTHRPTWPFPKQPSTRSWLERFDKFGWEEIAWPAASRGCSLMHSLYFAAPFISPCPRVVTVHDCIPLSPEHSHSRAARVYTRIMRTTTRKAAAIITVSEFSRAEIATAFNLPLDRIFVTLEAPDPALKRVEDSAKLESVRRQYQLPDRFVLYLGGTETRKNIETLARAWARTQTDGVKLVVVGRFPQNDQLFPDIPALVAHLRLEDIVQFVPRIESADLAAVYSAALAFCYPSRYEGFGLPPLEAMKCGVPVLAGNSSSLPEVLGDGADLIAPDDIAAWAAALERVITDSQWRDELVARGYRRAACYSWEATAKATLAVYDRILS